MTGLLEYPMVDETARVIKIASVNVAEDNTIMFRVATEDEEGKIVPLTSNQLLNFKTTSTPSSLPVRNLRLFRQMPTKSGTT